MRHSIGSVSCFDSVNFLSVVLFNGHVNNAIDDRNSDIIRSLVVSNEMMIMMLMTHAIT